MKPISLTLCHFLVAVSACLWLSAPMVQAQELLELPNFSPNRPTHSPQILELELLQEDELQAMQQRAQQNGGGNSQPLPALPPQAETITLEPEAPTPQAAPAAPPTQVSDAISWGDAASLPKPGTATARPAPTPPQRPERQQAETARPAQPSGPQQALQQEPMRNPTNEPGMPYDQEMPYGQEIMGPTSPFTPEEEALLLQGGLTPEVLEGFIPPTEAEVRRAEETAQRYVRGLEGALGEWSDFSLMYRQEEIAQLFAAIAQYKMQEALPEPVPLPEPEPEPEAEPMEEYIPEPEPGEPLELRYPIIYVSTILYHTEDDWAVWINGIKFSPRYPEALPGITVKAIRHGQVTIAWKPAIPVQPLARDIRNIAVENGIITITMQPNQALLSRFLEIHEGRKLTRRVMQAMEPVPPDDPESAFSQNLPPPPEEAAERLETFQGDNDRLNMNRIINLYKSAEETVR
jgi:hypothetical protein